MAAPKKTVGPKSDKLWRDALMLAVKEKAAGGGTKLRELATKVVDDAIEGSIVAAKEIGDRLDGKATQPSEVKLDATDDGKALLEYVTTGNRPGPR